jgi:four helix bundle protein
MDNALQRKKVESFRDLIAWQRAVDVAAAIQRATLNFPQREVYGLCSQMTRAAYSISSNIAEGQGKSSKREFVHFLGHARGSLFEVQSQVYVAVRLGYLTKEQAEPLIALTDENGRLINGLIRSINV